MGETPEGSREFSKTVNDDITTQSATVSLCPVVESRRNSGGLHRTQLEAISRIALQGETQGTRGGGGGGLDNGHQMGQSGN